MLDVTCHYARLFRCFPVKKKSTLFAAARDAFSYGFCFCNQTIGTGHLGMGVLMKLFQAPASGA